VSECVLVFMCVYVCVCVCVCEVLVACEKEHKPVTKILRKFSKRAFAISFAI